MQDQSDNPAQAVAGRVDLCNNKKKEMNKSLQTKWKISNFSQLQKKERVYSPLFTLGELKWRLLLFPEGHNTGHKTHLSVFLKLANPHEWTVSANFGLHVVASCGSVCAKHNGKHVFDTEIDDQGWDKLISLQDLEKSCVKYKNEVTIGVYVNVKTQQKVGDFAPNKSVSSETGVIEYGSVMLRIVTEINMRQHCGLELIDRTDYHEIPVNLNDHMTLNSFKLKICEETGIEPERQQFWNYTRRQNGTYRPNKKLTPLQMSKQVTKDVTYFVKDCDPNFAALHPNIFPSAHNSGLQKLIFVKYFDIEDQTLRFVGSLMIDRTETMEGMMKACATLIGLPSETPLEMYEEENTSKLEIPLFNNRLSMTLAECQIVTGDIMAVQKPAKKGRSLIKRNVKEFMLVMASDMDKENEVLEQWRRGYDDSISRKQKIRADKRRRKRKAQKYRKKERLQTSSSNSENPEKKETVQVEMAELSQRSLSIDTDSESMSQTQSECASDCQLNLFLDNNSPKADRRFNKSEANANITPPGSPSFGSFGSFGACSPTSPARKSESASQKEAEHRKEPTRKKRKKKLTKSGKFDSPTGTSNSVVKDLSDPSDEDPLDFRDSEVALNGIIQEINDVTQLPDSECYAQVKDEESKCDTAEITAPPLPASYFKSLIDPVEAKAPTGSRDKENVESSERNLKLNTNLHDFRTETPPSNNATVLSLLHGIPRSGTPKKSGKRQKNRTKKKNKQKANKQKAKKRKDTRSTLDTSNKNSTDGENLPAETESVGTPIALLEDKQPEPDNAYEPESDKPESDKPESYHDSEDTDLVNTDISQVPTQPISIPEPSSDDGNGGNVAGGDGWEVVNENQSNNRKDDSWDQVPKPRTEPRSFRKKSHNNDFPTGDTNSQSRPLRHPQSKNTVKGTVHKKLKGGKFMLLTDRSKMVVTYSPKLNTNKLEPGTHCICDLDRRCIIKVLESNDDCTPQDQEFFECNVPVTLPTMHNTSAQASQSRIWETHRYLSAPRLNNSSVPNQSPPLSGRGPVSPQLTPPVPTLKKSTSLYVKSPGLQQPSQLQTFQVPKTLPLSRSQSVTWPKRSSTSHISRPLASQSATQKSFLDALRSDPQRNFPVCVQTPPITSIRLTPKLGDSKDFPSLKRGSDSLPTSPAKSSASSSSSSGSTTEWNDDSVAVSHQPKSEHPLTPPYLQLNGKDSQRAPFSPPSQTIGPGQRTVFTTNCRLSPGSPIISDGIFSQTKPLPISGLNGEGDPAIKWQKKKNPQPIEKPPVHPRIVASSFRPNNAGFPDMVYLPMTTKKLHNGEQQSSNFPSSAMPENPELEPHEMTHLENLISFEPRDENETQLLWNSSPASHPGVKVK